MRFTHILLLLCVTQLFPPTLYAQALSEPVLEYELAPGEMAHLGKASVSVFANGRGRMIRPPYWRNSGTLVSHISREQLADLLTAVRSMNFGALTAEALAEAHAEERGTTQFFEVHDADRVTLVMRQLGSEERITVMAPAAQRERLPNQETLSSFADIDARFRALLSATADSDRLYDEELTQ